MTITDDMITAFRRAAFDRMMHEDGCPEGKQIRAGIAAIAPMIRAQALEDAARVADRISGLAEDLASQESRGSAEFWEQLTRSFAATDVAANIRALKETANG